MRILYQCLELIGGLLVNPTHSVVNTEGETWTLTETQQETDVLCFSMLTINGLGIL